MNELILVGLLAGFFIGVVVYQYMAYHEQKRFEKEGCPFGQPCLRFNQVTTYQAIERVLKLIDKQEGKTLSREEINIILDKINR